MRRPALIIVVLPLLVVLATPAAAESLSGEFLVQGSPLCGFGRPVTPENRFGCDDPRAEVVANRADVDISLVSGRVSGSFALHVKRDDPQSLCEVQATGAFSGQWDEAAQEFVGEFDDVERTWRAGEGGEGPGSGECNVDRPPTPLGDARLFFDVEAGELIGRMEIGDGIGGEGTALPLFFVIPTTMTPADLAAADEPAFDEDEDDGDVEDEPAVAAPPAPPEAGDGDEDGDLAARALVGGILAMGMAGGLAWTIRARRPPKPPPPPSAPAVPREQTNLEFLDSLVREAESADWDRRNAEREKWDASERAEFQPIEQRQEIEREFADVVRARAEQGYWVQNPDALRKIPNQLIGLLDPRAGQCGEFAGWGVKWMQGFVQSAAPGAITDVIVVQEQSSVFARDLLEGVDAIVYDENHAATRVVLPNGDRFVLDFWEHVGRSGGEPPKLIPEHEWVQRWEREIGEQTSVNRGYLERELKNLVHLHGEEEGIAAFRAGNKGHETEVWVRSWQQRPW